MTRYECEECFGRTQKPCVIIIPGNELWFRYKCLATPKHRAYLRPVEETVWAIQE